MSQRYAGGVITANQNTNFSGSFNGTNNYLSVVGASQYAIATSTTPFTVEGWIRPTAAGGLLFSEEYGAPTIVMSCGLAAANDISAPTGLYPVFGYFNGSAWTNAAASTTPVALNIWTHLAFVFTGSTSKIYINGIDVTKTSAPTPATTWGVTANNGTNWFIGRRWDTSAGGTYFSGQISNFRFVNGTAVYTSNFAPPGKLSVIANTVLLTCQSSTFFDASTYNATITNNGSTIATEFNPFYQPPTPALGAATPGVWTLSQANQAAGRRSWNMYDPYFNLTTAMIHGNGTNGSNNNTFIDSSSNNFTVTRNGNVTQGTFTPFSKSTGYWSSFNGNTSTGYLTVVGNSNLAFGTGDFTIECLFYLTTLPNPNCMLYDSRPAADGAYPCLFVAVTTNVLTYYVNTGSRITGTTPLTIGQWYHVVVSRVSGNTRMFLNGLQEGSTYVDSTTYLNGTNRPLIGNNGLNLNGFVFGYISNVRVLTGTGTTAPTVPTTPLTAITNTQLLTCQSSRFVDNSTNNFTVTRVGDARTVTYSPFYSPTAYLPQDNGGGMFFDGTGDFLSIPDNVNLQFSATTVFTIEAWVYPYETIQKGIIVKRGASATQEWGLLNNGSGFPMFGANTTNLVSSIALNRLAWNHIAATSDGTTVSIYINGVRGNTASASSLGIVSSTNAVIVGAQTSTPTNPFTGYIAGARVIKGTQLYSGATYTIPTAPFTAITDTQLLLNGTNASIFDNATSVVAETNNTSISTSQNKYGSGSMSFNGTSSYVSLNSQLANGVGGNNNSGSNVIQTLGDFTVECWVNPSSFATQGCLFYINGSTQSYAAARLDVTTAGTLQFLVSFNAASWSINTTSTQTLTIGTWSHIAIVRAGPSMILYLNGLPIITSTTITMAITLVSGPCSAIGAIYNSGWTQFYNGYISDFRATNYARYLGNFTPPTSTLQNQ